MPSSFSILVLVANEESATLSTNSEGKSHLLRSIDRAPSPQITRYDDPSLISASVRHRFACELMMVLGRALRDCPHDGVIIFADPSMMNELRIVETSVVSRLLIARIVGTQSAKSNFPLRAANGDMASLRALQ
jgi:hypothetical protein